MTEVIIVVPRVPTDEGKEKTPAERRASMSLERSA